LNDLTNVNISEEESPMQPADMITISLKQHPLLKPSIKYKRFSYTIKDRSIDRLGRPFGRYRCTFFRAKNKACKATLRILVVEGDQANFELAPIEHSCRAGISRREWSYRLHC
jgi:hypothetical protein